MLPIGNIGRKQMLPIGNTKERAFIAKGIYREAFIGEAFYLFKREAFIAEDILSSSRIPSVLLLTRK